MVCFLYDNKLVPIKAIKWPSIRSGAPMGQTKHTCNLRVSNVGQCLFLNPFTSVAYRNNRFSPIQFLHFKNYTTMSMVKIYILYKNFFEVNFKKMQVLNTEYNHVCFNNIVFDISYQQFLPVWNPTEEVIDIIFKYLVHLFMFIRDRYGSKYRKYEGHSCPRGC